MNIPKDVINKKIRAKYSNNIFTPLVNIDFIPRHHRPNLFTKNPSNTKKFQFFTTNSI